MKWNAERVVWWMVMVYMGFLLARVCLESMGAA